MSNFLLSPNMSLPIPVPGVDPGPDWANNLNSSLTIVDGHDHTPGSGVLIVPQAMNINTDLDIQNNKLLNASALQFSTPGPNVVPLNLYTNAQSGGGITDLFFNDGAGNIIPITKAGIVNAVAASIPGESYAGGTFTWKQGAGSTTPANFDIGAITLRPNTPATTNGITLQVPVAISSAYNLFLPALPVATSIMQLDSSGNITANLTVDNSTIIISSNQLKVGTFPDSSIAQSKMTPRTIGLNTDPGIGGVARSSAISQSGSGAGNVNITGLVVTLTTNGGPVYIGLQASDASAAGTITYNLAGLTVEVTNSVIGGTVFLNSLQPPVAGTEVVPPSVINFIDTTVAGLPNTYTYQVSAIGGSGGAVYSFGNVVMVAYELT